VLLIPDEEVGMQERLLESFSFLFNKIDACHNVAAFERAGGGFAAGRDGEDGTRDGDGTGSHAAAGDGSSRGSPAARM